MFIHTKSHEIVALLQRALKSGNFEELKTVPIQDLKVAKHELIQDRNSPYYSLLLEIIQERESSKASLSAQPRTPPPCFVHETRIAALKRIRSTKYDLRKLVCLCEELNVAYDSECYFATGMLVRAIIDHVPPIFGYRSFGEVVAHYNGTKSFKQLTQKFEQTLRHLADGYLHEQIRIREELPNAKSIDFSQELDKLLEEVCRITPIS